MTDAAVIREALQTRADGALLVSLHADGTETVFCGDQAGVYVGWQERSYADSKGWTYRADADNAAIAALAALDALVAEREKWEALFFAAEITRDRAVAERDEARAWAFARSDVEEYIKRAEAAVAERDEAKAQFWQQRHEWAAATGRNQEIIDGLLAERDDTERTNGPWKCLAETETKLVAAEAELAAEKLLRHQDDLALVAAEAERDEAWAEVEAGDKTLVATEAERDEAQADCEARKRLYDESVKDRVSRIKQAEAAEAERDKARKQSRESSEMFVRCNEQCGELLSQQSFMQKRLVVTVAEVARLTDSLWAIADSQEGGVVANNLRIIARAALGEDA